MGPFKTEKSIKKSSKRSRSPCTTNSSSSESLSSDSELETKTKKTSDKSPEPKRHRSFEKSKKSKSHEKYNKYEKIKNKRLKECKISDASDREDLKLSRIMLTLHKKRSPKSSEESESEFVKKENKLSQSNLANDDRSEEILPSTSKLDDDDQGLKVKNPYTKIETKPLYEAHQGRKSTLGNLNDVKNTIRKNFNGGAYHIYKAMNCCSGKKCDFVIIHDCRRLFDEAHENMRVKLIACNETFECKSCLFKVTHKTCHNKKPTIAGVQTTHKFNIRKCSLCGLTYQYSVDFQAQYNCFIPDGEESCSCGCITVNHFCQGTWVIA